MKKAFLSIAFVFVLFGCDKEFDNKCFDKQGPVAIERRELEPFRSILVYDIFDIEMIYDTVEYITIECGENLLPYIETKNEGVNLKLYNNVRCRWSREYRRPKLTIHYKKFTYFQNQESCKLYNNDTIFTNNIILYLRSELAEMDLNIKANQIKCWGSHNTSGKYFLSGECNELIVDAHSAVEFDFSQLVARRADVRHESIGNIKMYVTDYLNAKIHGPGNIMLFNVPDTINIEVDNGSGEIIPYE